MSELITTTLANPASLFASPTQLALLLTAVVALLRDLPPIAKYKDWALRFIALALAMLLTSLGAFLGLVELNNVASLGFSAWLLSTGGVAVANSIAKKASSRDAKIDSSTGLTQFLDPPSKS